MKNMEENKEYSKNWRLSNPKKEINAQQKYRLNHPLKFKETHDRCNKNKRIKRREYLNEVLGKECLFCKEKIIEYHEIEGKEHRNLNELSHEDLLKYLIFYHFVPLCFKDHRLTHSLMDLGFNWNEIYNFVLSKQTSFEVLI